jgi:hypothetical protein
MWIPLRASSFDFSVPPFGGFPSESPTPLLQSVGDWATDYMAGFVSRMQRWLR